MPGHRDLRLDWSGSTLSRDGELSTEWSPVNLLIIKSVTAKRLMTLVRFMTISMNQFIDPD